MIYLSCIKKDIILKFYFLGVFNCKADAKGRVMLPIDLRNQLAPVLKDGFVIKKSYYAECLELYPAKEWQSVMEELDEKSRFEEDDMDFFRAFTAGSRQIVIDAVGRLLIPKDIIKEVGITKNVVLSPIKGCLEIWDKELYDSIGPVSKAAKKKLAKKVMGTDGIEDELS